MLYAFVLFMGIIGVCAMLMNDSEDNPSDPQDCHVSWELRFSVVVTFIPILLILAFLFLLLFYVFL